MKYLSHYMEALQTAAFNKYGAFFAFSDLQFNEGKKENVKYVNMGTGLLCPKENAADLLAELDTIYKNAIKQDIAENGKAGIIERELHNHEAFYTGSIADTIDKLTDYGFTRADIVAEYNRIAPTVDY